MSHLYSETFPSPYCLLKRVCISPASSPNSPKHPLHPNYTKHPFQTHPHSIILHIRIPLPKRAAIPWFCQIMTMFHYLDHSVLLQSASSTSLHLYLLTLKVTFTMTSAQTSPTNSASEISLSLMLNRTVPYYNTCIVKPCLVIPKNT